MLEFQNAPLPVITEDRILENNLLEQFDELIGKVGGHEGLNCHGDVFWVLGLREGRLHNLHNIQNNVGNLPIIFVVQFQKMETHF